MKRVLLVDDDPLVLRLYRDGLTREGFEVDTATDGVAALRAIRLAPPDVMVLDLMMPKFSGVEVLKYIRSQGDLTKLPVIVLSNSYMNEMAGEAAAAGAQQGLLKASCTPALLGRTINQVLEGKEVTLELSQKLAAASPELAEPSRNVQPIPPPAVSGPMSAAPSNPASAASEAEFNDAARQDLLTNATGICASLRGLFQSFSRAQNDGERGLRMEDLYRKIHFLTATAGLGQCHDIARMASAFEALLFGMMDKPDRLTPSVMRTAAMAIDFFEVLFQHANQSPPAPARARYALVVDDDPLSNRLVVSALRQAQLEARSASNPRTGLEMLAELHYDLVLLDIEMPGLDGFEVCKQLRAMAGYQKTPVVYVTSHSDFESRTQGVLSGGDDLIAKPIFPLELAVKAVTHLLRAQYGAAG